jgi:hypothetical protein
VVKTPMAAREVARPFHRDGWVYEEKVGGWRITIPQSILLRAEEVIE